MRGIFKLVRIHLPYQLPGDALLEKDLDNGSNAIQEVGSLGSQPDK